MEPSMKIRKFLANLVIRILHILCDCLSSYPYGFLHVSYGRTDGLRNFIYLLGRADSVLSRFTRHFHVLTNEFN